MAQTLLKNLQSGQTVSVDTASPDYQGYLSGGFSAHTPTTPTPTEVRAVATPEPVVSPPAPPVNNNPPTSADLGTGTAAPQLPKPEAPASTAGYIESATKDLENKRKSLEESYQKQIDDLKTQREASQAEVDKIATEQKGVIEDKMKPLSEPFRASYETSERQRLQVEQNYFANQALTNELGTLLTEGNDLIKQMKETTGLGVIRNPRVNQAISDVNARAGVLQAVMSARSGQIAEAYRLIDRGLAATEADRTDQLNYYKTLYNFYQDEKDTEGKKLVTLTANERKYLDAQIGLLEGDLNTAKENAENIKKAMTDPDTAMAYAQSGVTLNDTPQQINVKLADYGYKKEVAETSKDMSTKGYSYLTPGQTAPTGTEVITTTDSKGNTKQWYKATAQSSAQGVVGEYQDAIRLNLIPKNYTLQDFVNARKASSTTNNITYNQTQDIKQREGITKLSGWMGSKVGKDGYVSPTDFKTAKQAWVTDGYSSDEFDKTFSNYVNPKYSSEYGAGFKSQ
jgi:hypothetical protein